METEPLLPKHGGYRKLKSFQVAQLCHDVTVRFCARYIDPRSRTRDQMVQAARSGVQNIAEGSQFSATSKKLELKLTQAARSSLEELKVDYEDFLRQRDLPLWPMNDPRRQALVAQRCSSADAVARWIVELRRADGQDGQDGQKSPQTPSIKSIKSMKSMKSMKSIPPPSSAECAANVAHVLIGVAASLLDRQMAALASAFVAEGGFTERLSRVRRAQRRY